MFAAQILDYWFLGKKIGRLQLKEKNTAFLYLKVYLHFCSSFFWSTLGHNWKHFLVRFTLLWLAQRNKWNKQLKWQEMTDYRKCTNSQCNFIWRFFKLINRINVEVKNKPITDDLRIWILLRPTSHILFRRHFRLMFSGYI